MSAHDILSESWAPCWYIIPHHLGDRGDKRHVTSSFYLLWSVNNTNLTLSYQSINDHLTQDLLNNGSGCLVTGAYFTIRKSIAGSAALKMQNDGDVIEWIWIEIFCHTSITLAQKVLANDEMEASKCKATRYLFIRWPSLDGIGAFPCMWVVDEWVRLPHLWLGRYHDRFKNSILLISTLWSKLPAAVLEHR